MRGYGNFSRTVAAAILLVPPVCASAAPDSDSSHLPAIESRNLPAPASASIDAVAGAVVVRIEFAGLRRIAPEALRPHISSSEGQPLDPARVAEDVRGLDRLGWFDSVSAEVHPVPLLVADARLGADAVLPPAVPYEASASASLPDPSVSVEPGTLGSGGSGLSALFSSEGGTTKAGLCLVFVVEERPYLARVDFTGSHVLSHERIRAVLEEKHIALKLAAPANPTELWHARRAIEQALADLGHPQARVQLHLEDVPTAAVAAKFEISDGPLVRVARVNFAGNQAFSEKELRRQMKRVTPDAYLAGLRDRKTYTPERLAEDLDRIASFYRNHGYPEARVGTPAAQMVNAPARGWLRWPRRSAPRFYISIPVQEGHFFRLSAVTLEHEVASARAGAGIEAEGRTGGPLPIALRSLTPGEPYSAQKIEAAAEILRRASLHEQKKSGQARGKARAPARIENEVETRQHLDREEGVARISFLVREAPTYIVRRLEFTGQQRFSDRYYRRHVLLKEGEAFDPAKLELGLEQLARTGFVRPVKPEDLRVRFDDARHTADVAIRFHEIGRQRLSLTGGQASYGSTIGIVYNVFNLLGGEELITGHLEGGPQSLQVALSIAKEGVFGTRVSLGMSLFQNVLRPMLSGAGGQQHLFTARSTGLGLNAGYPLTPYDTLGVSYQLARNSTTYDVKLPPSLTGLAPNQLTARTTSRTLGLSESRDTGRERREFAASASGGWLGGDENLVRASTEYARLIADPFSSRSDERRNAWAFRAHVSGVSSYRGELPLHSRIFGGEQLARGFRSGELTPYGLLKTQGADGATAYRAQAAGSDLVAAVNTEYRVPLAAHTEAAAFFDAGSGWLLPGWVGPDRPALVSGTNGVLRASAGIEMRWRVPVVEQTVRVHYALNPLRLAREVILPDGGRFRAPDRRAALGWALGALF